MSAEEEKAASALAQKPFEVILGGRKFGFRPLSLSDREELSVIVSSIEVSVDDGMSDGELMKEAIRCGKYGRQVASFVATGAHVRGFAASFRRWLVFRRAYKHASIDELVSCIRSILDQVEPAFFLGIIISLSRQNILKPTKETAATARG
jgi:hypothetical protein